MPISHLGVGAKIPAATLNALIDAANATGLALVAPSSVAGTGVTMSSTGVVTLASATSASLNGVFTSAYDNYRIKGRLSQAASTNVPTLALRAGGTDSIAANYDETLDFANSATPGSAIFTARANWQLSASVSATEFDIDLDIESPALAPTLTMAGGRVTAYAAAAAPLVNLFGGGHRLAAAFDGFTLVSASALTGTLRVYGYNNG